MHQIYELTLKITFFSASQGAHPPQTPPVPTDVEGLSGLNLGAPSFEKFWIRPPGSAPDLGLHLFTSKALPRNLKE